MPSLLWSNFKRFGFSKFINVLVKNLRFFIILNISSKKSHPFPKTNNNQKMNIDFKTVLSDPS